MGDDLLVQSAQAGQEWAFAELCARNSKRVFKHHLRCNQESRGRGRRTPGLDDAGLPGI